MLKILLLVQFAILLQLNMVVSEKKLLYSGVSNKADIRQRHADLTYAGMKPSNSEQEGLYITKYFSGNVNTVFSGNISSNQEEDVDISLNNILSSVDLNDLDFDSEKKAKLFYESCINSQEVNDPMSKIHFDILKSITAWPISSSEVNNDKLDIYGLTVLADIHTKMSLIKRNIVKDSENKNMYIVVLEPPNIEEYIYYERIAYDYEKFLDPIINYLEGNPELNLKEIVQQIIAFGSEIQEILPISQIKTKRITIQSLKQKIPDIDWDQYFSKLTSEPISEMDFVIIKNWDYFKKLGLLLKKTSNRIVANFLLTYIIHGWDSTKNNLIYYLPAFYHDNEHATWAKCIKILKSSMSSVLNRLYLKHNFNSEILNEASKIIRNLKKSLKKTFENAEWLDDLSRLYANDKLNNIAIEIGTDPNSIFDDDEYKKLKIEANELFSNLWNIKYFEYKREYLKLDRIGESDKPTFSSIETNIVNYNNKYLFVPASILQPPYFHIHFPSWSNYAWFGSAFAYHLAGIFNFRNIEYNSENKLNDWWNTKLLMRSLERTNCYILQYKRISDDEFVIMNPLLYDTMISAEGGLKIAVDAYENWLDENDYSDGTLEPHLTTNFMKLFFIGYAQMHAYRSFGSHQKGQIKPMDLHTQTTRNNKQYNEHIRYIYETRCNYW